MTIYNGFGGTMNKAFVLGVAAMLLSIGCGVHSSDHQPSKLKSSTLQVLKQASASYKMHRDYASLKKIFPHLTRGMKRSDVERLLGEPDHSPCEGLFYYSSDREESLSDEGAPPDRKAVVGIVLDYRDKKGVLTDRLQKFWIGPIGE